MVREKIKQAASFINHFTTLLVGVPHYETYVEHMRTHHPEETIQTRKQFFCQAQDKRYNAKGGNVSRCC
ncbi:YbdD/YjiX family protein [Paenibacillus sp. 481]|uniref:YbdD/YjiX family protein n=1 Tax=Paenibacillus sp. 481 TaxID=2835869 RepID=UPI001E28EEA9|nr:YbdD/YjiX family protein [Paenibacillus sp. 481]UHA71669.1 YbdD/YjiX family protein [Paenibacillus sp. 481]